MSTLNEKRKKIKKRNIRRFFMVTAAVLLLVAVGAGIFEMTNKISAFSLSRQEGSHSQPTIETSAASVPASSLPGTSADSSSASSLAAPSSGKSASKPASSAAGKPSSAGNSSVPASSASSVPPMDPAVYQAMYPNLYAQKSETAAASKEKVVYLTFDDGPSNLTIPLLDVLDKYNVKATFFLVGKTDAADLQAMKAIVDRGHGIGVHSYTHNLHQIYQNPAVFLDDFAKMHDLILKTTGVDTHIYRFAGGSVNSYNKATARAIITEMNRRGYTYYDWNVSSDDAVTGTSAAKIYSNVVNGVHAHTQSVILCHNTNVKKNTLAEVPKMIETLKKEGYEFRVLDDTVDNTPYIFRVPK